MEQSQRCPIVSLKISIFLLNAAWYSCVQYLSLHAQDIGFSLEELTVVLTCLPIAACIGPPVAGLLADKFLSSRLVLIILVILCTVSHMLLLLIDNRQVQDRVEVNGKNASSYAVYLEDPSGTQMWNFVLYLALRTLAAFTQQGSISMLDTITISMTKKHNSGIGLHKIFGVVSQGIFSFASSAILEWTASSYGYMEYSYVFYLHAGLVLLSMPFLIVLDKDIRHDGCSFSVNQLAVFKKVHVILFTIKLLTFGACWGFHSAFYQLYLVEIDANKLLLGLSVTVGCITAVPLLMFSDLLVKKFGTHNVLCVALMLYSARFGGYSLVTNPWLCLVFDSFVTQSLGAVASNYFCESISHSGNLATVNGIMNSVLYGIGKSIGNALGGSLIVMYSYRVSYAIFSALSLLIAASYLIYGTIRNRCRGTKDAQDVTD